VWMFHDHVEKAFTTNGVGEGGDISLVVYKGFYDDKGIPASHGMSLAPYFAKSFWKNKYPIWQDYDAFRSLGLPDLNAAYEPAKVAIQKAPVQPGANNAQPVAQQDSPETKLLFGFMLGLVSYLVIIKRATIFAISKQLFNKLIALLPKKKS
jgi:manganese oxidase